VLSSLKTRRIATAGLILGILGLGLACLLALRSARENAREANCMSNVHGIGFGCAMYADAHGGRLPRSFEDLSNVITSTRIYICPSASDQTRCSYELTGTTNLWNVSPSIIVLREIEPNHHGKRVVLYDDGRVGLSSSANR